MTIHELRRRTTTGLVLEVTELMLEGVRSVLLLAVFLGAFLALVETFLLLFFAAVFLLTAFFVVLFFAAVFLLTAFFAVVFFGVLFAFEALLFLEAAFFVVLDFGDFLVAIKKRQEQTFYKLPER